jgi:hypothetical protein
MLFAIDESKVEELRRSSEPQYTVTVAPGGVPVALTSENYATSCYSTMEIAGTVPPPPNAALKDTARENLMAIRKKIEESGEPLKSVEVLTAEIARRRSRTR